MKRKNNKQTKRAWGGDIDRLFRRKAGPHKDKRDKRGKRENLWRKEKDW